MLFQGIKRIIRGLCITINFARTRLVIVLRKPVAILVTVFFNPTKLTIDTIITKSFLISHFSSRR